MGKGKQDSQVKILVNLQEKDEITNPKGKEERKIQTILKFFNTTSLFSQVFLLNIYRI
jgi:hypothetical protein